MIGDKSTNNSNERKAGKGQPRLNHSRGRNGNQLEHILGPGASERPLIAVFGSSQARADGELYRQSYRMGELLGRAGFNIMTGGYTGVMEAVSRGGHETGAKVIGVTMKRFEDRVNRYVMREIRTSNFYMRFRWLVDQADGYVAMGGGIGTLAEVSFTWQSLSLGILPPRPFVLVGDSWHSIFDNWAEHLLAPNEIYEWLTLAQTPEAAADSLTRFFDGKASDTRPSK